MVNYGIFYKGLQDSECKARQSIVDVACYVGV